MGHANSNLGKPLQYKGKREFELYSLYRIGTLIKLYLEVFGQTRGAEINVCLTLCNIIPDMGKQRETHSSNWIR